MRGWLLRAVALLVALVLTSAAVGVAAPRRPAHEYKRALIAAGLTPAEMRQVYRNVQQFWPRALTSATVYSEALGVETALVYYARRPKDIQILFDGRPEHGAPIQGPDLLARDRRTNLMIVSEEKGRITRAAAVSGGRLESGIGRELETSLPWLVNDPQRYLDKLRDVAPAGAEGMQEIFDGARYAVHILGTRTSDGVAVGSNARAGRRDFLTALDEIGVHPQVASVDAIVVQHYLTAREIRPGPAAALKAMDRRKASASAALVAQFQAEIEAEEAAASAPATAPAPTPFAGADGVVAAPGTVDELGGVDFSSLELRYMSDVSSDKTRAMGYAFKAPPLAGKPRHGRRAGVRAALRSSDAFFVWLALPTSAMWVNLNPSEPDRIIEPRFGRTTAGRVLLEADLRMKKTAARLTNPSTPTGRRYWNELDAITGREVACSSARMWIVPAPATVRETADELYIVKAPLRVKLESDLLGALGSSCGLPVYRKEIEAVFRRLILPRVQRAVRSAPEYAALRSVYMSRVAAEWYRKRADREHGAFADIVDGGDISRWAPKRSWTPRQTFRRYVRSYEDGEYRFKRRTRKGNVIYTYTYTYGGVDFADVPRTNVSSRELLALRPGLPDRISRALTRPTADPQTGDVWLAGASFDRAAAANDPVFTGEQVGGGLSRPILLLVLCVVLLAAAAWSIVRWKTKPARYPPG